MAAGQQPRSAPDSRRPLDARLKAFGRRAAGRLAPDAAAAAKEERRLRRMPRGVGGTTTLLGTPLSFVDGPSFASQWQSTFVRESFRFVPDRPRPLIVDVGANVGLPTTYWLRDLPECRVVAIEADPRISEVLEDNLRVQGFTGATVINVAVAATRGVGVFVSTGTDMGHLSRAGIPGDDGAATVEVRMVPLADYLGEPVDLLKVDIEGAESVVLEAASDHLDRVERIVVEFHHFIGDDVSGLRTLLGILDDAGFSVYVETEGISAQPLVARDPYCGMDFQMNIFGWREAG